MTSLLELLVLDVWRRHPA